MLDLLDKVLAELARLLVARGVPFPDLAERLKGHYVRAATDMAGDKQTDSRLSVLTGLQRRDIVRLKSEPPKAERPNHLATLISVWRTDPVYAGQDLPKNGPAPSFEALAGSVRRDVHPRTMLDALVSVGTVEMAAGDRVRLLTSSYQPLAGSDDQIGYLARNLGDHIAAATDNVLGQTPPHFERAVHYGGLTADQIEALKSAHRAAQMQVFEDLAEQAAGFQALKEDGAAYRFRAGAFFYPGDDGQSEDDGGA